MGTKDKRGGAWRCLQRGTKGRDRSAHSHPRQIIRQRCNLPPDFVSSLSPRGRLQASADLADRGKSIRSARAPEMVSSTRMVSWSPASRAVFRTTRQISGNQPFDSWQTGYADGIARLQVVLNGLNGLEKCPHAEGLAELRIAYWFPAGRRAYLHASAAISSWRGVCSR